MSNDDDEVMIPAEGRDAVIATPMVTQGVVPTPMGVMRFSPEVENIFNETPRPLEIHIRDTGEVYVPQNIYRERLFRAFGPGGWGLRQLKVHREGNLAYFEGVLVACNQEISQAIGESEYHTSNPQAKWSHAVDAAKSDCLKKCCKDLIPGFSKLWDRAWTEQWRLQYAYEHWRKQKSGSRDTKPKWRRKDMPAHFAETGPTEGQKARDGGRQPAVRGVKGARGSAALREAEGLEPQDESPAASEARRIEFESALSSEMPIEMSPKSLEHLIGIADTLEQMENAELVKQLKGCSTEHRGHLATVYGKRRLELGFVPPSEFGDDPQGDRQ